MQGNIAHNCQFVTLKRRLKTIQRSNTK